MSRYLNPKYETLAVYTPGEQPQGRQYIKLNTNESPFPPSKEVLSAISSAALADLRLYSDPECVRLRAKLAAAYDTTPEHVFVSNGSDDILNFAFMAFAGGEVPAYFPDVTYGFYPVFAALSGVRCVELPLLEDFSISVPDYCGKDGLIVIANPNAPTGIALSRDELETIIKSNPDHVVVVDEAYVDFGAQSCVPLTWKYKNLLVVMTFSKSRCMAGARLGFAIGTAELIADLNRLKYATNPYNVNRLTLLCGEAAIDSDGYFRARQREIMQIRGETMVALQKMGFTVLQSEANFIFMTHPSADGGALYRELKARGVLVRHFDKARIRQYNRVTIGTRGQMSVFLTETKKLLERGDLHEKQ